MADSFTLWQDLAQAPGAQDITKRGLSQQSRGTAGILDVRDSHGCIVDLVVHDSINRHGYAVFGEDLVCETGQLKKNSQKHHRLVLKQ